MEIRIPIIDSALETARTAKVGWLPGIGGCFNMTFDPEERAAVVEALRALRESRNAPAPTVENGR